MNLCKAAAVSILTLLIITYNRKVGLDNRQFRNIHAKIVIIAISVSHNQADEQEVQAEGKLIKTDQNPPQVLGVAFLGPQSAPPSFSDLAPGLCSVGPDS